ncbi:Adrm1b protein, partial [Jimgerdemannia flammicorona]
MSLFPTPPRQKHLVEFKAGKCTREGNLLKPDLRKGLVYMDQSDDSLMHFYWKDRKTNIVEDDLIIFPEEAEFVRVTECTTGRVYLVKFKSSNRKLFFWMQDKSDEKDEEHATKVNRLINSPDSVIAEQRTGAAGAAGGTGNTAQDVLSMLGGDANDLA